MLADDLTGLLDVLGPLAPSLDEPPSILLDPSRWSLRPREAVCLGIDTKSRHLASKEAAARTAFLVGESIAEGFTVLYKKVDSTLRGNVGAEVAALLGASGRGARVIFAPAYPEAGRTVEDGTVLVEGVPLAATAFARDPLSPAASGNLAGILRPHVLRDAFLRQHPSGIEDVLGSSEAGIDILDSRATTDLDQIAEGCARLPRPVLLAGSGGLGRRLPAVIGRRGRTRMLPLPAIPALVVNGSLASAALDQVDRLQARGCARIEVGGAWLDGRQLDRVRAVASWGRTARALLSEGRSLLLGAPPERCRPRHAAELGQALGRAAAKVLLASGHPLVVIGGGETAAAFLEALEPRNLTVLGEVTIGVNLLRASLEDTDVLVATRSGAFGTPSLLDPIPP